MKTFRRSNADAAIAVASLRRDGLLGEADRIVYVDTDAHLGNGVCHTFMHDSRVFIFDIFNSRIYPMYDVEARQRVDCEVPLTGNCTDVEYMDELQHRLPGFLDAVTGTRIGLAVYNAGSDILAGDPLGDLNISANTILQRDLFVVSELRNRGIPTIMLLSGGYTRQSFQLVANSVMRLLEMTA